VSSYSCTHACFIALGIVQGQAWVSYNTSKAAVKQMARSMACELAPEGIRVNSLSPGYIYTKCATCFVLRAATS
jgi:NAD(P)-dependent dehydrogenase (short-subunit alcohol dehydrogenase family)